MIKHRPFHAGFTIIEIVVTISILAILATIITISYDAFVDNANQSQISTVVDTAKKTLKAAAFEKNSLPDGVCIPSDGYCCTKSPFVTTDVMCQNTGASDLIKKYSTNNPTYLPDFQDMQPCSGSDFFAPCTSNGADKVGIYFFTVTPSGFDGMFGSTDPSVKGFLTYVIAKEYKCGSNDLFVIDTDTRYTPDSPLFILGPAPNGATYSYRNTDTDTGVEYNACFVAIK